MHFPITYAGYHSDSARRSRMTAELFLFCHDVLTCVRKHALLLCTWDISVLYLYYNEKTIVEKLLFLVYTTSKYLYRRRL